MAVYNLSFQQTIRSVLYEMETRNSGQIVGISSIAGYYGETFGMAYWYFLLNFYIYLKF